jgi:hypothetical protein
MGCVPLITKEEVANARKNNSIFVQPSPNQTRKESLEKLDALNNAVEKIDEVYYVAGQKIKSRVSELSKRKGNLKEKSVNKDNDIKRDGGTFVHEIMKDLMNFNFGKGGSIAEIKKKAISGEIKLQDKHFDQLNKLADTLHKEIIEQQKKINDKENPEVRAESFVADFLKDVGGTGDLIVVYSDNSFDYLDFKTSGRNDPFQYENGMPIVRNNILPYYEIDHYHASNAEYVRILQERLGLGQNRRNRLIPIPMSYKMKPIENRKSGEELISEVDNLVTIDDTSEFLRQIPVGGERSKYEGINKLLEKQSSLLGELTEQLKKSTSHEEKQHLKARIANIEKSINRTIVDTDIFYILQTIGDLTLEAHTRLQEDEYISEGVKNPAYLSGPDLKRFIDEMKTYKNIIDETHMYFEDIKEENKEQYEKLKDKLFRIKPYFDQTLTVLNTRYISYGTQFVRKEFLDVNGNLRPFEELNIAELGFEKISEINNPIFKAAWNIVEDAQYDIKKSFEAMDKEVYGKLDNVFKWAKGYFTGGDKRQQAFNMIIDPANGNLIPKIKKGFIRELNNAIADKGPKGVKLAKDSYDFKNKEAWLKEYKQRLDGFKAVTMASLGAKDGQFEPTYDIEGKIIETAAKKKKEYDKRLDFFIKNNDLVNSDEAWTNKANIRTYLKLKDSVVKANLSDEYKKIQGIAPLLEFYDMWNKYMESFAEMLGITNYTDLPPNFIPNIRKEMIEHLSLEGMHWGAAIDEFFESFSVREEDTYLNSYSPDGIERRIPILFMNKFRDKNGKIDNTKKSYDLSTSLMIFGKMAYNYKYMHEIEPKINALKTLLGEPSALEGGIESTDRLGRKIKGKFQPFLTKEGRMTETYKLFEDITDFYLYGVKFKQKTLMPGVDMVHVLSTLKSYNAGIKLGFAFIPAAGAWTAGTAGLIISAGKGIQFNNKQLYEANKMMVTEPKKYHAIVKFWDAENDDYVDRELTKHMASSKKKVLRSRTLYYPLRVVDTKLTSKTAISMMQNWGLTKDGNLIRFTEVGKKKGLYKDIKPLIDLIEYKDGEITIPGLSKEAFKQFRAAIKATVGETIGNMNPDDIGAVDTNFFINQMMAFKSWMPAVVKEYLGDLRWDETTQAMRWGRFKAYMNDYRKDLNFTEEELEQGKLFYTYMSKVVLPNMGKLILDISTFGLAPKMGMQRINEKRAQLMYQKWLLDNPGLKDTVTYDHFLEIKEAQIKAMLIQLRIIFSMAALAMFLGAKGDDGEPRYYENRVTRAIFKIFSKAGSELTFMWNPAEFVKLVKNPWPLTSLLTQTLNTAVNGFDETRDIMFGENSKQDKSPIGYYMFQYMYGAPQLMRTLEVYENMKKNPYSVFDLSSR